RPRYPGSRPCRPAPITADAQAKPARTRTCDRRLPWKNSCPSRRLGRFLHALGVLDRALDRANHQEGLLGQMVVLAGDDALERADRVLELDELAGDIGEDFRDMERLAHEALNLAGASDGQLVLFRQ